MSNEIQTKSQDNFLAPLNNKAAWGNAPTLSKRDLVIPRINMMQGLSEKVTAGEATFGDLVDSISGEVLGGVKEAPLEIIPISMKKIIVVEEYNAKSKKYEYKEIIPGTPENEALPYEQDGIKRTGVMSFFVLLPRDIAMGGAIPKVLSIRGTSRQAGRIMATQMYAINGSANPWLPPPAFTFNLSVKIDKNDKGTFAVLEAKKGRKSTDEEIAVAFNWNDQITKGDAKIDEEDLGAPAPQDADVQAATQSAKAAFKKPTEPKDY